MNRQNTAFLPSTFGGFGQQQGTTSAFGKIPFGDYLFASGSSSSPCSNVPSSSNNRGLFGSGSSAFPPQPQTSGIFSSSGGSAQIQQPAAGFFSSSSSATQPQNGGLYSNLNHSNLNSISTSSAPSTELFSSGNNASKYQSSIILPLEQLRTLWETAIHRVSILAPIAPSSSLEPANSSISRVHQLQHGLLLLPTAIERDAHQHQEFDSPPLSQLLSLAMESQTQTANTSSTAEATSSPPTETSQQTSITLANLPVLDTAAEGSPTQAQQYQKAESVSEALLSRNLDLENLSSADEDEIESDSANLLSSGQDTGLASIEATIVTDTTIDSSLTLASASNTLPSTNEHSESVSTLTDVPSTAGSQPQTSS